jgi:hypothetical protein
MLLNRILRREARSRLLTRATESVEQQTALSNQFETERIAKKSPAVKETGFQVSGFRFQVEEKALSAARPMPMARSMVLTRISEISNLKSET